MKSLAALFALGAMCVGFSCQPALAQEASPAAPNDPIAEHVFAPELIMKYQKAIQLTETQKNALIGEVKRAQGRFVDVQWDMQRAMEPLVEALGKDKPDEQQVLAQLDKVLAAERDFKRVQLTLVVRLKGILTPEQQRMLLEMRGGAPRAGDPAKPGAPR
jgi:Spy/CpxP family protein refolding chaperone